MDFGMSTSLVSLSLYFFFSSPQLVRYVRCSLLSMARNAQGKYILDSNLRRMWMWWNNPKEVTINLYWLQIAYQHLLIDLFVGFLWEGVNDLWYFFCHSVWSKYRCSHSEKKYGPPSVCEHCSKICAFPKPADVKKKVCNVWISSKKVWLCGRA